MTHALFALLVALSAQPTAADDLFVARGGGTETIAQMFTHNLLGPDVQLGFFGHALRGRAFGVKVDLSWDAGHVIGLVGGARVDLTYRERDGRLELDGTFAGGATHLSFGPAAIVGNIGHQKWAMTQSEGQYVGDGMQIDIPQALALREAGERAAVLPVLLVGVTRAPKSAIDPRQFRVVPPAGWPSQATIVSPSAFPYAGGAGGPSEPVRTEGEHRTRH